MFNRREFCKKLLGLGTILSLPNEVITAPDLICSDAIHPDTSCVSYSRKNTILFMSGNAWLKDILEMIASTMNSKIYYGEQFSPDIIAIPNFAAIIDRSFVGEECWNLYLRFFNETEDDTPLVIIDNLKNFDSPGLRHIYYLSSLNYYSWADVNFPALIQSAKKLVSILVTSKMAIKKSEEFSGQ